MILKQVRREKNPLLRFHSYKFNHLPMFLLSIICMLK